MSTNDDTPTHFQNDQVSVTLVKKPGCLVEAEIKATPLAAQAAYEQAIKTINKEVSLPGFRKGKAPVATIVKQFGSTVDKEWKDVILNISFQEVLQLTNIYPFSKESVKHASVKNISKEDGAEISISYECAPKIPHIDPAALTIKEVPAKLITEELIEDAINGYQLAHAEWTEVTDRPVAEGDFAQIDIHTLDTPPQELYSDHRVKLQKGRLDNWLYTVLVGMNIGESREGKTEPNPNELENQQEFVSKPFKVTLKKIESPILPTIDEEFVKKFGVDTPEAFRERIVSMLEKHATDEQEQASRHLIEETVLDQYYFDVPSSLVQEDLIARKTAFIEELKEQGIKGEALKTALASIQSDLEKRVERDLRILFITQEVARQNQLTVSQDELTQEFMEQLYLSGSGNSIIHKGMEPAEVNSKLKISILMRKVLDFLRTNANTIA